MARLGVVRCLAAPTLCTHLKRVNSLGRKARGPQAAGGNKLQVADVFFFSLLILCCHGNTWFHLN